jgi:hypothetical protein
MVTHRWKKGHEKLPRLEVDGPTGFRNINRKRVIILDELGGVFYDTGELDNPVGEFNLPTGIYYVLTGKIAKMPEPVPHRLEPLPPPERFKRADPETFEVDFIENPFTGSVFWDVNRIYFDNSLRDVPLPTLVFVLYHEYAHRYYKTEHYCDLYARNRMLMEGYNPSQIGISVIKTLSPRNYGRMLNVINTLL